MLRKVGLVLTVLSFSLGVLFLLPLLWMMFSASRVDSEVGTMVYGLPFTFGLLLLLPFLALGVLLWTVGIYKKPLKNISSTFEKGLNFLFIVLTSITLLLLLQNIDVVSLLKTVWMS